MKFSGEFDYRCLVEFKEADRGRVQTKINYPRDKKNDIKKCSDEFKKHTDLSHILGNSLDNSTIWENEVFIWFVSVLAARNNSNLEIME